MTKGTAQELLVRTSEIKGTILVLRAINHPLPQKIMQLLHKNQGITVRELYTKLRQVQSVASQQLAILKADRFVNSRRDGKCVYYEVNYDQLQEVHNVCNKLTGK